MPHNAGKRLVEAIDKQLERIAYFSSAENISPNLAVHEMRKIFKRTRALLKFYIDFPEEFPPEYSTQIKYFGRSLSVMRESFVNMQLFDRIAAASTLIAERKIRNVKDKLADKNKEIIETGFFEAEGYLPIQKFAKNLEEQMEKVEINTPSVHQFVGQLKISYQQAYDYYLNLGLNPDASATHDLRKKMKRLWYQFDFIRYVHPRFFKLKTYHLNNITEQLGEDHDLYVLFIELKQEQYDFNTGELEILENQVQHLREINLLKLNLRLKHFFNEPPELFNQKIEAIFKMPIS
jgi:CHAD domain-containing protein